MKQHFIDLMHQLGKNTTEACGLFVDREVRLAWDVYQSAQCRNQAMLNICDGMSAEDMEQAPFTYKALLEIVQRRDVRESAKADSVRDTLATLAEEVLEWNLESNWGSGASKSFDEIIDRYSLGLRTSAVGNTNAVMTGGKSKTDKSDLWVLVRERRLQNIMRLIDPAPIDLPSGRMVFKNPNAAEILATVSKEIRAMLSSDNFIKEQQK